ncbi:hypothetical protein Stsp01_31470 [Streptomyces sp. NBRC 13847]|nr:hypothetical protein Stsp01_31470 [Streptomyces sp. NBRC 13847]
MAESFPLRAVVGGRPIESHAIDCLRSARAPGRTVAQAGGAAAARPARAGRRRPCGSAAAACSGRAGAGIVGRAVVVRARAGLCTAPDLRPDL